MSLLNVIEGNFDGQQQLRGHSFPLVLQPAEGEVSDPVKFEEWVKHNASDLEQKAFNHGAIIFRGFNLSTAEHFLAFLKCFPHWDFDQYSFGGAPRKTVLGPIKTANESPPEYYIPLHHELAYQLKPPKRICFFSEISSTEAGQTPLLDSNHLVNLLKEAQPEFIQSLIEKKIRHHSVLSHRDCIRTPYQQSWQDTFKTEDPKEAERIALSTGTEIVEWIPDPATPSDIAQPPIAMKMTSVAHDVIRREKRSGLDIWFNSLVLLHPGAHFDDGLVRKVPWSTTYGDNSPISDEDVRLTSKIMKENSVYYSWQNGDIIFIDNYVALHGRNHFKPPRRVLAAFSY